MNLKQKILHEIVLYFIYTAFLALFFGSLTTYHRLILGEYSISYFHYGYGLIQALILAKVILIGESLRLGERFANKPLIFPIFYKTIVFTFLVLVFAVGEHFASGFLHGVGSEKVFHELLNTDKDLILAKILIIFIVFIPFFAFIEISRALGERKFIHLLFGGKVKEDSNKE